MEISNSIKFNYKYQSTQNREISAEGGIQACEAHGVSLPSISPAYYSPSFMGKKNLNHSEYNGDLSRLESFFNREMLKKGVPEDKEENYYGIYYFLRDESEYTDAELEGICRVLVPDIINKELNFILPEFNKKAFCLYSG